MTVPNPTFRIAPLPEGLSRVQGYRKLQTFFPAMSKLAGPIENKSTDIWFDNKWRIHSLDLSGVRGPCKVTIGSSDISGVAERDAYVKVTHLLDPVRWMQGKYSLPSDGEPIHEVTVQKLQDQSNQAYVEAVACYALGRIADAGGSPHFNSFFGAFCARADMYRFNINEDFQSFRHSRWFWDGKEQGLFTIQITNPEEPNVPVPEEFIKDAMTPGSIFSESEDNESEVIEAVEVDDEEASIHSDGDADMSFAEEEDENEDGLEEEDEDEDEDEDEQYHIYSEIKNFPVMLIVIEKNQGTMDALLEDYKSVGSTPDSDDWELIWSAWMFQILAGLSAAQAIIGFTHNDLHTNNIVWIPTTDEFLFYKTIAGAVFKVPTYGKVFKIIDFGRAIFSINGQQFISDDFKTGNDADGQYAFPPLVEQPSTVIPPNASFDLARLAVSVFEGIFPVPPADKEGGAIISSEEGIEVKETVAPLFNCMWKWMLDDNGENILNNADGSERFPDFDLYKHIAEKVHGAVPSRQFVDPAFDRFQVNPSTVGDVKCWSLFC